MKHICPWWFGHVLASPLRRLLQDPVKLLGAFVREGMTVLEPGCGMGFFTLDLVRMVGKGGRVVAVDLQQRMLDGLRRRANRAGLAERIELRLAQGDRLGIDDLAGRVDLVLAIYVLHELTEKGAFFSEVRRALKTDGRLLAIEPPRHVSAKAFSATLAAAEEVGWQVTERPPLGRNWAAVMIPRS